MAKVIDYSRKITDDREKPFIKIGEDFVTIKNDVATVRKLTKEIKTYTEKEDADEFGVMDIVKKNLLSEKDVKKLDSLGLSFELYNEILADALELAIPGSKKEEEKDDKKK